jgi:hypothetical protein
MKTITTFILLFIVKQIHGQKNIVPDSVQIHFDLEDLHSAQASVKLGRALTSLSSVVCIISSGFLVATNPKTLADIKTYDNITKINYVSLAVFAIGVPIWISSEFKVNELKIKLMQDRMTKQVGITFNF